MVALALASASLITAIRSAGSALVSCPPALPAISSLAISRPTRDPVSPSPRAKSFIVVQPSTRAICVASSRWGDRSNDERCSVLRRLAARRARAEERNVVSPRAPPAYNASRLQRMESRAMKSATLPSLRVEPELRQAAESVLQEGETLSGFIEASVRETIERRRTRAEFIARGLVAREEVKRTGEYHLAREVHTELARMLEQAKGKLRARPAAKRRG